MALRQMKQPDRHTPPVWEKFPWGFVTQFSRVGHSPVIGLALNGFELSGVDAHKDNLGTTDERNIRELKDSRTVIIS